MTNIYLHLAKGTFMHFCPSLVLFQISVIVYMVLFRNYCNVGVDLYQILHFVSKYKWLVHAVCFIFRHYVHLQDCYSKELQSGALKQRKHILLWSWCQQSKVQVWAPPVFPQAPGRNPSLPPSPTSGGWQQFLVLLSFVCITPVSISIFIWHSSLLVYH